MSKFISIDYSIPPAVSDLKPTDEQSAEVNARAMLAAESIRPEALELTLLAHILAVFHWRGVDLVSGEQCSGWLVGGAIPHLVLNDDELQSPVEALAIYAFYLRGSISYSGPYPTDGSVPIYRLPTNWSILCFENGFTELRVGAIYNWIIWNLLISNSKHIKHEDIQKELVQNGWVLEAVTRSEN